MHIEDSVLEDHDYVRKLLPSVRELHDDVSFEHPSSREHLRYVVHFVASSAKRAA